MVDVCSLRLGDFFFWGIVVTAGTEEALGLLEESSLTGVWLGDSLKGRGALMDKEEWRRSRKERGESLHFVSWKPGFCCLWSCQVPCANHSCPFSYLCKTAFVDSHSFALWILPLSAGPPCWPQTPLVSVLERQRSVWLRAGTLGARRLGIPAVLPSGCVALAKLLNLSVP